MFGNGGILFLAGSNVNMSSNRTSNRSRPMSFRLSFPDHSINFGTRTSKHGKRIRTTRLFEFPKLVSNALHLSTNTIHLILGSIDTRFHFFVLAKAHGRGLFEMINPVHELIVFRFGFLESRSSFGFVGMSSRGKNGIAFVLESLFSILKITKSRFLLSFNEVDVAFLGLNWSLRI
jgi:hypothetical protein